MKSNECVRKVHNQFIHTPGDLIWVLPFSLMPPNPAPYSCASLVNSAEIAG